jgi:hypothetical protein
MNKNKQELHWQPISFLPQIREMIDGMLERQKRICSISLVRS